MWLGFKRLSTTPLCAWMAVWKDTVWSAITAFLQVFGINYHGGLSQDLCPNIQSILSIDKRQSKIWLFFHVAQDFSEHFSCHSPQSQFNKQVVFFQTCGCLKLRTNYMVFCTILLITWHCNFLKMFTQWNWESQSFGMFQTCQLITSWSHFFYCSIQMYIPWKVTFCCKIY